MNNETNAQRKTVKCGICKVNEVTSPSPQPNEWLAVCNDCKLNQQFARQHKLARISRQATQETDFFTNLTEQVKKKHSPVFFREKELLSLAQILLRKTENNAVLIGESGLGKTSIVEEFAHLIHRGEFSRLNGYKVLSLDMGKLIAGTKHRGDFEKKFVSMIEQIGEKSIIFIDEMHMIMGAGSANNSDLDMANLLKPILSKNDMKLIGATTLAEYRRIEKDPAFSGRFKPIRVNELSKTQTRDVLEKRKAEFEEYHNVEVADGCIDSIINLTDQYIKDTNFPKKAIDILDQACTNVSLVKDTIPSRKPFLATKEAIDAAEGKLEHFYSQYPSLSDVMDLEQEIQNDKNSIIRYEEYKKSCRGTVEREHILQVIEDRTQIPVTELSVEERSRLLHIEEEMQRTVVGQDDALKALARAIRRSRVKFGDDARPTVLLFDGPSGCGKSAAALAAAKALTGTKESLIHFDMSEYMEKHHISKLIGSPPGYAGYEEEGQLTEKVRRNPYSIVLLDEFEKAHKSVADLFLQVFEYGRLTDNKGRVVDFSNTIIIMTTNIGVQEESKTVGFFQPSSEEKVNSLKALNEAYRPEFINRIDEVITFNTLSKENMLDILEMKLENYRTDLENYQQNSLQDNSIKIQLDININAKHYLVDKGFNQTMGARPLERLLKLELKDVILEKLLFQPSLTRFKVSEINGELHVS